MYVSSLELADYRNIGRLNVSFSEGTNIFFGDNAQGKTNILEAVYLAGTTRSHKGSKDREMIRQGEEESHIRMDLVRAGITLYGLWPSDEVSRSVVPLKPVMTLYSRIVYIKEAGPGVSISYGGTFTTSAERTRIATVPVGYGDGYPRSLSGKGYVLVCGRKAPILGRVCMDQMMIDVTDIPEAREGSLCTLIGTDGAETITAEELGDLSGRFNYELACDISARVPRITCGGQERS